MSRKYTRLPSTLFTVIVPMVSTYSDLEMDIMGVPLQETSSGKRTACDDTMTRVMLPLTRIIDIYRTGAPIKLVNVNEVPTIFKILEDYLHESNSTTMEFNIMSHEDNRDVDIDRFASEMFDLNRVDIVNETLNKKSGFDIGIPKLHINNRPKVTRRRMNVSESYSLENPSVANDNIDDVYLTSKVNYTDPEKVTRKSRIRKRQSITKQEP